MNSILEQALYVDLTKLIPIEKIIITNAVHTE